MRVVFGALLLSVCLFVPFSASQTSTKDSKAGPTTVGGKTITQWKLDLTAPDPSRRAEAVIAITRFGDANAECVLPLIKVTHDADVSPRVRAVIALRMIAVDQKNLVKVIEALAARLNSGTESEAVVRLEAVVSLKRFVGEPALEAAVSGLIKGTLDKRSWEIRYHCVSTLWRVGRAQKPDTAPAIYEALLSRLTNPTWDPTHLVQMEAIKGLGALGKPTSPVLLIKVVTTLSAITREKNEVRAIWAYSALAGMQEGKVAEGSLLKITKFLKNDTLKTRIEAANSLGWLGSRAKSRVPMLIAMLGDSEEDAVWAACNALGDIGEAKDDVVDALLKLLAHKEPSRAAAAVTGLVNLRVNTTRVMGTFEKMRENKDVDLKLRGYIEQAIDLLKKQKK